jgi:hypothetical protein
MVERKQKVKAKARFTNKPDGVTLSTLKRLRRSTAIKAAPYLAKVYGKRKMLRPQKPKHFST